MWTKVFQILDFSGILFLVFLRKNAPSSCLRWRVQLWKAGKTTSINSTKIFYLACSKCDEYGIITVTSCWETLLVTSINRNMLLNIDCSLISLCCFVTRVITNMGALASKVKWLKKGLGHYAFNAMWFSTRAYATIMDCTSSCFNLYPDSIQPAFWRVLLSRWSH